MDICASCAGNVGRRQAILNSFIPRVDFPTFLQAGDIEKFVGNVRWMFMEIAVEGCGGDVTLGREENSSGGWIGRRVLEGVRWGES
jgi:hypothetical protein